jgi:hypothetical protein
MALRQGKLHVALQAGQQRYRGPGVLQALAQHLRMARTGHAIGQHAGKLQFGTIGQQALRQRADGLAHAARIDDGHHRDAQQLRQVGAAGFAIEEAHDAFDQQHVGLGGRQRHLAAAVILAAQPQVEVDHRLAAGLLQHHGIEEIGAGLEHPHPLALAPVQARQRGGDGGLAVAGGRGRDEQGRAAVMIGHQNSTPFCAFTPCSL